MITRLALACLAIMIWGGCSASARDERCLAAMQESVQACTSQCVAKAREAVDPSMQDFIVNHACAKNCLKIQMFHGNGCA